MLNSPKTRLGLKVFIFLAIIGGFIAWGGRGPDYQIQWSRQVPSKLSASELSGALLDTRNWTAFHHALKSVKLYRGETPVKNPQEIEKGMIAVFEIEPTGREWKRYRVRSEITEVVPGVKLGFKLLEDSTGKTTRMIDGLEWSVSVGENAYDKSAGHSDLRAAGYPGVAMGEAKAFTLNRRARFFGRYAAKIFMNQIYQIDLVRLANYEANVEAKKGGFAPVYQ
ncbi:MAG: hypothetical protein H7301_10440 [Cryobacterium sp.]|nr:hypothetical protein [Oligoflexia bacterium]